MSIQDEIRILTSFYPVLSSLPESLQHALLDCAYPVHAAAGDILFDTDSTIVSFLLLTQGSIRVIRPELNRELLLYRVQPGTCCVISICHLLGDTRCCIRAQVESDISGVALPQTLFKQMLEQSTSFDQFIFEVFAGRLFEVLDLLEAVTSRRLDERLAGLLAARAPVIKITHSLLADELGSAREVISRILKDFEERGMVKLERGEIRVLMPDSLIDISQIRDSGH